MVFYLISVVFEDCHVDKLVLLGWLKLETVLLAELLLESRKLGVYQNFLQLAYYFVELVVLCVVHSTVTNFKVFVLAEIIAYQVLA